jgi:hypothetical protein
VRCSCDEDTSGILLAGSLWAADVFRRIWTSRTLAIQELDRAAQKFTGARTVCRTAAQRYREAACLCAQARAHFAGWAVAEAGAVIFQPHGHYSGLRDPPDSDAAGMLVRVNAAMIIDQVKAVLRIAARRFPKGRGAAFGLARWPRTAHDLALAESLRFEQTGATDAAPPWPWRC